MKRIGYASLLLAFLAASPVVMAQKSKKTTKKAVVKKTTKAPIKKKVTKAAAPVAVEEKVEGAFMLKGFAPTFSDSLTVSVMSTNNPNFKGPSAKVQNGQFLLTGSLPSPGIYNLVIGNATHPELSRYVDMFLDNEPSAIKFTGEGGNFEVLEGKSLKAFSGLVQHFGNYFDTLSRIQQNRQMPGSNQDSLTAKWDGIIEKVKAEVPGFLQEYGNSPVAPFLLCTLWPITNKDLGQVEGWINSIDSLALQNDFGQAIKEYVANEKFLGYGQLAPEFSQNDPQGKAVGLKDFRGKYVLVDFWASWCGPCRRENPNVVTAYNKYKDRNFTVLGVSLDKEKARWVDAIAQDGLTWTQVSDLGYWNNAVARLYKVQSIPQNFILDPQGKIIGKNLRGEELDSFLADILGK